MDFNKNIMTKKMKPSLEERRKIVTWWNSIDKKVKFIYILQAKEKGLIPSFVTSANITGRLIEIIYKNRDND